MKKIFIKKTSIYPEYDADILNVSKHADHLFQDHRLVARAVKAEDPYVAIVILENLDPKFWNNKKYVEKTMTPLATLWEELLLKYFLRNLESVPVIRCMGNGFLCIRRYGKPMVTRRT